MKKFFCNVDALLEQSFYSTFWIKKIGSQKIKLNHYVIDVLNDFFVNHSVVIIFPDNIKEDEKNQLVALITSNLKESSKHYNNNLLSFVKRKQIEHVEKNDSFLATELKDLKFLKKVSNPIVLGPWWFQCLAHFFTKNITVIDTANAIVPRVLKSGLNYLPFFFAPLLTVLGLIFRFLNIFLCAVGDIIDKFIYLLVVSWPLFLHGDLVNMNSLLPGLVIMLCSIVFLQKNVLLDPKTTTEIESKEYLVKNFAIGGYLMFFFFFYAVIILFPFICFIFGVEKICVIKLIYLTIQLIVLEKITFYQTSLFLSSLCAPFIFQFGLITSIIKNVF